MEIEQGIEFLFKGNDKDSFKIIHVDDLTCVVICNGYEKEWEIPLLDAKKYFATKKWILVQRLPKVGSYDNNY